MRRRVLVGIASVPLAQQTAALIEEDAQLSISGVVTSLSELMAVLEREQVEVVLVHDDLDSMPVMELVRRIAIAHPETALVILSEDADERVYRDAMQAGARGVIGMPLAFQDLSWTLTSAAEWAWTLQQRNQERDQEESAARASMICVAGSKGGVGTTTVAVQLALYAVEVPNQSVCLVDFDLQTGDVRLQMDVDPRRTITDLVDVSGELTPHHLDETLYPHPSGMRVLLPPKQGERAEEVTGLAARAILGSLRARFDVVIVDVGSVTTEVSTVALDMADEVLVVATPDVPGLRSVNRLTGLWDRLQVSSASVRCLLNRASKDLEIQPDFAKKVLSVPVIETSIPDDFSQLENALNAGAPQRVEDDSIAKAISRVGGDIGIIPKRRRRASKERRDEESTSDKRWKIFGGRDQSSSSSNGEASSRKAKRPARLGGDKGAASIELTAVLGMVLLVGLLAWQIMLVGYTFVLAGNAAQEGSGAMAVGNQVEEAAVDNLPSAWLDRAEVEEGEAWVEVRLGIPVVIPQFQTVPLVTSRMGTVIEDET